MSCNASPSASAAPHLLAVRAEHADREEPHGAGDAAAVADQLAHGRRAHAVVGIHLHAVDHGVELAGRQVEARDRVEQGERGRPARASLEQGIDLAPPARQLVELGATGASPSATSSTSRQKA